MNIGRPDHWTHALLSEELVELFNQATNRVLSREHPSNLVYYTINLKSWNARMPSKLRIFR